MSMRAIVPSFHPHFKPPNEQKTKKGGRLCLVEGHFLCTSFFSGWFSPNPCYFACVFLINPVLLSGVFGCAGIVACTMFSHPRLGHTLFSNFFPPSLYLLLQSCIANDMPHPVSSIYTHVYAHVFITINSHHHDTNLYNLRDTLPPPYPAFPELNDNREQSKLNDDFSCDSRRALSQSTHVIVPPR